MTLHLRAHRLRARSAAFIAALLVATAPPARTSLHRRQSRSCSGEIESTSGCRNDYTLYRPSRPATALAVMVVPGFMRDRDRMRGWADAIAHRGMTVVTMDFCQPTAFDGRHAENARDMIAVREALGLHDIVYVGHSAGGLASLLAAADDGAARAMVLLDPVDFADLCRGRRGARDGPGAGPARPARDLQPAQQRATRAAPARQCRRRQPGRGDPLRLRVAAERAVPGRLRLRRPEPRAADRGRAADPLAGDRLHRLDARVARTDRRLRDGTADRHGRRSSPRRYRRHHDQAVGAARRQASPCDGQTSPRQRSDFSARAAAWAARSSAAARA